MKKAILIVFAFLLVASFAFAGGAQEKKQPTPAKTAKKAVEQVMVAAYAVGPGGGGGFKPIPNATGAGNSLIAKMFTPLTIFDKNQENIIPYAAESWKASSDYKVWTFKLNPKLKWSDGKPVTAEDVKFTVEYETDPKWAAQVAADRNTCYGELVGFQQKLKGQIKELSSVKVIDDHTVQFTLSEPNPRYYARLIRAYILPKHALNISPADNVNTNWWLTAGQEVGSGPFYVTNYVKDDFLELSANPYYFLGKPKLKKFIVKYFSSDESAAVLALAAGNIDFSYINYGDIKTLGDKVNIFEGSSGVPRFLDYNYKKLPAFWKDIRVRKAIYYAIDRPKIVKEVFLGTHEVIPAQFLPHATWPKEINWYPYNPEKAKQLLKEAGVKPSDIKMDVIGYKKDPMSMAAMQAVQSYLADIGIKFNYTPLDVPSYRSRYKSDGNWTIVYRGTGGLPYTIDPKNIFSNDGAQGGKFRGFDMDKYFALLIRKAASAPTSEEFLKDIGAINLEANKLCTQTWLWAGKAYGAALKRVKDFWWYPANGGGPYMDHAEKWYIGE
ncbi:MAG: ABC transporter substrate-binding protein [Spirochaetales bacterium]|nr:ABC transporter substrate-binding protein [Spirochaetales bacterium]